MFALALQKISQGGVLTPTECETAFTHILKNEVSPADLSSFLTLLHQRGETADEVLGAAKALRREMTVFTGAEDALDIVGTGGDSHGTYNISSAVIFVLAGAGIKIAKHGNRAVSSKSGASDFLSALGVNVNAPMPIMQRAYAEANVAFLMAPLYHTAMKHVASVRASLGFRTIFNLLGPLANPARAKRQLVGVFDKKWCTVFAEILQTLGSTHALVAHGGDGLDEVTTTTQTFVAELKNQQIKAFSLQPEDAGLPRASLGALKGGDAATNAQAFHALLNGEKSAYRDIVLLNAAAGFMVADKTDNLKQGLDMAAHALDSGLARQALEKTIHITNAS